MTNSNHTVEEAVARLERSVRAHERSIIGRNLDRYVRKQEVASAKAHLLTARASHSTHSDELVEALKKIERACGEWDPDACFASTALAEASAVARAALTKMGEKR